MAVTAPQGIAAVICQQLRYEILETQTEGDRCVATMKIRVPDAVALVQRALKDMGSYEEAAFLDRMTALLEETAPMREATVEVELTRIEENWYLVNNGEFSDAITGGMLSRRLELEALIREALGDPNANVRTVHRLDQVVSGLMVFARRAKAASELSR